jgi:hypothetical protein
MLRVFARRPDASGRHPRTCHPQLALWSRVRGIARLGALQVSSFDVKLV